LCVEILETLIDFFSTSGKEGRYQVILKKIDLPVVPREACLQTLRKTRLGPYFKLHESFICAGGTQGKDTCKVMIFCWCLYHSYMQGNDILLVFVPLICYHSRLPVKGDFNPLAPELNPSTQRCLMRIFTGDFAS
jgi:hypothetical protein